MLKSLFALFFVLLFAPVCLHAQLWVVDPLEALYPDTNEISKFEKKWSADFISSSKVTAHLLVKMPPNANFTLTAHVGKQQLPNTAFSQLLAVPVEQNTGVDSRTEMYKGEVNPNVIRRAPFQIFEVIQPLKGKCLEGTDSYQAFRFVLPEKYVNSPDVTVQFKLHSDARSYRGEFKPRLYDVAIPSSSESGFFYTNWMNLSKLEYHHGVDRWTDNWYEMLEKYARLMAHGRQNAILIPPELLTYQNQTIALDQERLGRFIELFQKYGFRYFEAPHLMNRGPEDDWGDPELKVALTGRRYHGENGKKDVAQIMTLFRNFAVKHNLVSNWLQHVSDEPTAANAKNYGEVAAQVKQIFPEVKIMEATNDRDNLVGSIDIWCPIINDFQENEEFFRKREQSGEQILVYTCLVPGGKWLNRTLDMEKLRQVYFGWGAAFYNTNGYLHWGLNQYHANPYAKSVVKHPSPAAGANNYLPAGDTHIIYPGSDGPLSSLRFEAHRVGIEDYELLRLLKRKDTAAFHRLMSTLFRSYTDYNTDLQEYRNVKKEMLQLLAKSR